MTSNSLMVIDAQQAVEQARGRKDIIVQLRKDNILRDKVDYGVVPGTNKPTLLKPGAERLCAAFGLNPQFEVQSCVERWDGDDPLFFYQVLCRLIHIDSGLEIATGLGSCNSRESKWRWRWVSEENVPPHQDKTRLERKASTVFEFDFAVRKAETSGQYGKPAEYWQQFKDAIEDGTARKVQRETKRGMSDGWEIGGTTYRVPNDDPFSLINTYLKMACKRALIAAVLIGANASEFFTQDVEDMPGFGVDVADLDDTVDGSFEEIVEQHASTTPAPQPDPEHPPIDVEKAKNTLGNGDSERRLGSEPQAWVFNRDRVIAAVGKVHKAVSQERYNTVVKMMEEGAFSDCLSMDDAVRAVVARLNSHREKA